VRLAGPPKFWRIAGARRLDLTPRFRTESFSALANRRCES
jgi:hypothetical protein